MILFLDFDGTTHPYAALIKDYFCCLPRIERVLREFPQVRVVISSWWRQDGLESVRKYFSQDIKDRVIDVTPIIEDRDLSTLLIRAVTRHYEILEWIQKNEYQGPWVALDDDWMGFPDFFPQLIRCDSDVGVDAEIEEKLRQYFSG